MKQGSDGPLKSVYDAAARFVEAALITHGSLFTPHQPIWSDATIADLYDRFVKHPDDSSASFEEKFQKQLKGGPADTYQLAAELLYVHLLPGNSTGGDRKRELINTVLGWSPAPVEIPPELAAALDVGLAAEGTAFRTYRPFMLIYLLEFIRKWWSLSADVRHGALADPWVFKEIVFSVPAPKARSQAEILLHLVHPDHFEDIMSQRNKNQITQAFADLVQEPTDDVDRQLLQIRNHLTGQLGERISFWSPELHAKWQPTITDKEEAGPASVTASSSTGAEPSGRVWAIALGEGGRLWNECQELGMIAIGWDFLGDLSQYGDQEEIAKAIAEHRKSDAQPTNQSLCCWEFAHKISVGDTVIAKIGRQRLLGVGVVRSGYEYRPERAEYKNTRQVEWTKAETTDVPEGALLPIKTLTEVTNYRAFMEFVSENYLVLIEPPIQELAPYSIDDALTGLFMPREDFERMLEALRTRKNVLLQGPPGVG